MDKVNTLSADKTLFAQAIKRVSVLVDESYNQIKLSIAAQALTLSSQNPTLGGAVEEIPINYEGEPVDIALNYVYLIDCLKEIDSEKITIDFETGKVTTPGGEYTFPPLAPSVMAIMDAGGLIPHVKQKLGLA